MCSCRSGVPIGRVPIDPATRPHASCQKFVSKHDGLRNVDDPIMVFLQYAERLPAGAYPHFPVKIALLMSSQSCFLYGASIGSKFCSLLWW